MNTIRAFFQFNDILFKLKIMRLVKTFKVDGKVVTPVEPGDEFDLALSDFDPNRSSLRQLRLVEIIRNDFELGADVPYADVVIHEEFIDTDLKAAVEAAIHGKRFIKLNSMYSPFRNMSDLTADELRIVKLIAQRKTSKEISEIMFLAPKTIENKRYQICKKLKLAGHNSLLLFAVENRKIIQ